MLISRGVKDYVKFDISLLMQAFDALLTSLDSRGIRESHLRLMLQKIENSFRENVRRNVQCTAGGENSIKNEADEVDFPSDRHAGSDSSSSTLCGLNSDNTLETSSSFKIELGKNESEKKVALRKYQDVQRWIWKECYNSSTLSAMKYGKKRCKPLVEICDMCLSPYFSEDTHCNSCHRTFAANNGFNFSKHAFQCGEKFDSRDNCILDSIPLRTRLVKALLACIEVVDTSLTCVFINFHYGTVTFPACGVLLILESMFYSLFMLQASVPLEAIRSIWTEDKRKQWGAKLSSSSSINELFQV